MNNTQDLLRLKRDRLNINDFVFLAIILVVGAILYKGWVDMHSNYILGNNFTISLNVDALPYYTLRTTMRLLIGLVYSFAFAIIFGTLAAKYKAMERVILPFVNFMESVPLVGFLTFTTIFFLSLYPHSVMGLECAAIFGVFTSQAWNMCLVIYQTLRIVPQELTEAAHMFHYSPWQRFWKIEFPYSIPGLLWNTMVSQAAAWFALVATEAIPVKNNTVALPGVGSYISTALTAGNMSAVIWAIVVLILNIIILDQLFFRPLVRWANKFKFEDLATTNKNSSWFYDCMENSFICKHIGLSARRLSRFSIFTLPHNLNKVGVNKLRLPHVVWSILEKIWYLAIGTALIYYGHQLWEYFPKAELSKMPELMLYTTIRVVIAMLLSIIIFVPIGIWIGLSPRLMRIFQPIIQILAALPANIFYPLMAIFLIASHQGLSTWSILLIMIGTQWYILFNVIAGASTLPNQLLEVSQTFHVGGWLWWRKFMIPAIFPYIVTGIISAAGGAWNASITAEVIQWGKTTEATTGLGAYIANTTNANQLPSAALGCTAMCFIVGLCIVFIWHPLYKLAENKFKVS
jgi:NitT/TauT family transport system permease protein